ncbi:MarR family winged helix-turn-helix transcriptional regulator [Halodurantibacterium flavum]|uniref:MarR family winged helix-turn-helix transcriptional regulator n=1 Tax=Halodurantibacterium flavum TaxID=1382802 RepID=A0ABW4S384_9RHOB
MSQPRPERPPHTPPDRPQGGARESDRTSTAYRLHESVLYQMTLTSRLQERRLDDALRTLGLTRITWCTLLAVQNEGLRQPSEIAEFIGVDRTALSRALRQMEEAGWLERRSGAPDRRTTTVELTAAGCDLLAAATPLVEENGRHFLGKLGPGEAAELGRLMARLREGEARDLPKF